MREIKFRAKKKTRKKKYQKWVYGNLYTDIEDCFIMYRLENGDIEFESCIKETIGQFTGLYDKNNTPIYEGDIVKSPYTNDDNLYIIAYWKFGFMLQGQKDGNYYDFIGDLLGILEVRGNIYESEVTNAKDQR